MFHVFFAAFAIFGSLPQLTKEWWHETVSAMKKGNYTVDDRAESWAGLVLECPTAVTSKILAPHSCLFYESECIFKLLQFLSTVLGVYM